MAVQVGRFPPWNVDADDIYIKGALGREFVIKCHTTPGMGNEVVALIKDSAGAWQFAAYIDDYVDGNFQDRGEGDMKKYLAWLVTRIQFWLDSLFKPSSSSGTPTPTPAPTGTLIEQVQGGLKQLKFTANPDGTFTVKP